MRYPDKSDMTGEGFGGHIGDGGSGCIDSWGGLKGDGGSGF